MYRGCFCSCSINSWGVWQRMRFLFSSIFAKLSEQFFFISISENTLYLSQFISSLCIISVGLFTSWHAQVALHFVSECANSSPPVLCTRYASMDSLNCIILWWEHLTSNELFIFWDGRKGNWPHFEVGSLCFLFVCVYITRMCFFLCMKIVVWVFAAAEVAPSTLTAFFCVLGHHSFQASFDLDASPMWYVSFGDPIQITFQQLGRRKSFWQAFMFLV